MIAGVAYPERLLPHVGKMEEWAGRAVGPLARRTRSTVLLRENWCRRITEAGKHYVRMSDVDLQLAASTLRPALVRKGFRRDLVANVFAIVREAAQRTLGQRHFDVQLLGGWVLLTGRVAEMDTGEGKTLVATLPVFLNALTGRGVHVVPSTITWLGGMQSGWVSFTGFLD